MLNFDFNLGNSHGHSTSTKGASADIYIQFYSFVNWVKLHKDPTHLVII